MSTYTGPVIDAHIHLWDLGEGHYPWLAPGSTFAPAELLAPLQHDYLPADYRRDVAGLGVVASVHVEALWESTEGPIGETRWLDSLAIEDGVAAAYVAGVPFGRPDTGRLLAEQAENPRVKAVRQVVAWDPRSGRGMAARDGLLSDPDWRDGVVGLEEAGLHLELLLYPWQCWEVAGLAERHPGLTVIVDHIASPVDQSPEGVEQWRRALDDLASVENVLLKVSSVGGYLPQPGAASIEATIRVIRDAFPAERLMFGSDFPVGALLGLPYGVILDAARAAFTDASSAEQTAFFAGTAARVFDLDVSGFAPIVDRP